MSLSELVEEHDDDDDDEEEEEEEKKVDIESVPMITS
jgi:hypothetical protein